MQASMSSLELEHSCAENITVVRTIKDTPRIGVGIEGRYGAADHGVKPPDVRHHHELWEREIPTFQVEAKERWVEIAEAVE